MVLVRPIGVKGKVIEIELVFRKYIDLNWFSRDSVEVSELHL